MGNFPIGMTHDELNNIFTARSLFLTHAFAPGTAPAVLPTAMSNFTVTVPEVPVAILTLLIGAFPFSLFAGRLIGAILSVLSILAVYLIALHVTKKRLFAIICALLMSINPWSFLLGRTMAELNFFVVFFLWGFFVLIKSKGWKIFRAVPLYLLGFFSYTGGQISFYVFMVITVIYHYFTSGGSKKYLKVYIIFIGLVTLVFAGYLFVAMRNQSFDARGKELYLPNSPEIAQKVDLERKLAVQTPFNNLFINKATVYVGGFLSKYIDTFSVDFLFLKGEARAIFSYQTHGTFYLIDLLFIIIGLSALFTLNKKGWIFFLAVITGCSVTSGLSLVESSYSQRAGLIYPFLIMLSGIGIATVVTVVKLNKARLLLSSAVILIYLVSVVNLTYIYFFRFPVYASDGWFFQDRVLANYIRKTEQIYPDINIYVYTPEPKIIFEEYLFYTNLYNKDSSEVINQRLDKMDYSINNLVFINSCPDKDFDKNSVTILDGTIVCDKFTPNTKPVRITRLKDVYENYLVYNDKLCSSENLNRYIPLSAYSSFSVEKQPPKQFCLDWITEL